MLAFSTAPTRLLNQITRHIERTIGPSPMVFHEMLAFDMRFTLHVIPPQGNAISSDHPFGRNFFTIVTCGLSAKPIPLSGESTSRRAELMITLPADWPGLRSDGTFHPDLTRNPAHAWPLRWLKQIARLSHESKFGVAPGKVISNGTPPQPFADGTHLAGSMAFPSALHPRSAELLVHDDLSIAFYALWPLRPREIRCVETDGVAAVADAFRKGRVTDCIDLHRRSCI